MSAGSWRAMQAGDIPQVVAISDAVHGDLTESAELFAERLALYPAGCMMFTLGGEATGYLISHPWKPRSPVPLDTLVDALPADAESYYIHDLALLPAARGLGAGRFVVEKALRGAANAGFRVASLVAVNGADSFWEGQGFRYIDDDALALKLQSYGAGTYFMERELP